MTLTNVDIGLTIQAVSAVVIAVALVIQARQAWVMGAQLKVTQEQLDQVKDSAEQAHDLAHKTWLANVNSTKAQAALFLVDYLQRETVRQARATVLGRVAGLKNLQAWNPMDEAAADLVASSYDVAAILIAEGVVPKELFDREWGPSVRRCFPVIWPRIEQLRAEQPGRHSALESWAKRLGWAGTA